MICEAYRNGQSTYEIAAEGLTKTSWSHEETARSFDAVGISLLRRRLLVLQLEMVGSEVRLIIGPQTLERILSTPNPTIASDSGFQDLEKLFEEMQLFQACRTVEEVRGVLRESIEVEAKAMLDLLEESDAFDVIELMRMRELSIMPIPFAAPADGSALSIEIVSAVLLSRSSRKPHPRPREETNPSAHVEELHQRAARLTRLASFRQLAEASLSDHPLALLAAEYQGHVLAVRNLQFGHIRLAHETRLFSQQAAGDLLKHHLGYRYDDLMSVRSAMTRLSSGRLTALRDRTGNVMMEHSGTDPGDMPEEVIRAFREAIVPFMFLPAERSALRVADVAEHAGIEATVAEAVLASYAQTFDSTESAAERLYLMLTGTNPFLTTPLVSDGEGNYCLTSNDIGLDSFRRIVERSLPADSADFRRYDRSLRQVASEGLAVQHLSEIFGQEPTLANFHYYGPRRGIPAEALSRDCIDIHRVAEQTEGDALFVVDDVAFVVEVKGKSIADPARRGDTVRLERELKATIGHASVQAKRLETLIAQNGGFWRPDNQWFDLSYVEEIRAVVIILDDIGPLGTNLGRLVRGGILPDERPPLVLSLHDLAVMAEILERPAEFLLYLRRRTDSPLMEHVEALDELDVFMQFLDGNLYIEEDPDDVRAAHPSVPPIKNHQRRLHSESAVATLVGDSGAALDAWMARDSYPESYESPVKPALLASEELVRILDEVRAIGGPGWLRCGADLLGLAGEAQERLLAGIRQTVRSARSDGRHHEAMSSYAGLWGHPTLFVAARPEPVAAVETANRLESYARAKRYQLTSDRSYLWLFNPDGALEAAAYIPRLDERNAEKDRIVAGLGLQPIGDNARPLPPYARRTTKRISRRRRKR